MSELRLPWHVVKMHQQQLAGVAGLRGRSTLPQRQLGAALLALLLQSSGSLQGVVTVKPPSGAATAGSILGEVPNPRREGRSLGLTGLAAKSQPPRALTVPLLPCSASSCQDGE